MPFSVGLTGGIASGKSSAAEMFGELGAAVVDTDAIAHELTRAGGPAIGAIRDAFGAEFILADGSLDRESMRRLVFRDPAAKAKLEAILHPLIREQSRSRVAGARQPYVVLVVPLLFETGACRDLVQRVLVVDCDEERQLTRAMHRSRLSAAEVRAIMAAQLPRAERVGHADDVLDNDGDMEALRRQVTQLHAKYLMLARGP
jgi:dephospho-CoA kinase